MAHGVSLYRNHEVPDWTQGKINPTSHNQLTRMMQERRIKANADYHMGSVARLLTDCGVTVMHFNQMISLLNNDITGSQENTFSSHPKVVWR